MGELKDFFIRLKGVLAKDKRFKEDAYLFVMAALGRVVQGMKESRHPWLQRYSSIGELKIVLISAI
jgi:hypothetical protein